MTQKKSFNIIENKIVEIPSDNVGMENFILKNKISLMESVISSIEYAVFNDLKTIEVFKFENSEFVITISETDYISNVDNIYQFYLENEKYELCKRVVDLQYILKNQNTK